jgi:hypothetical protein
MNFELNSAERDLLAKILGSYLSDLRTTIAATQVGTSGLHAEEELIKRLQARLAAVV